MAHDGDPEKVAQLNLNKRAHADVKAAEQEVKELEAQLSRLNGGPQQPAARGGMAPQAPPPKQKAPAQDVDAQAQVAIQTVNADKSLTPAQKQVKINAIQQRRNQLVGI